MNPVNNDDQNGQTTTPPVVGDVQQPVVDPMGAPTDAPVVDPMGAPAAPVTGSDEAPIAPEVPETPTTEPAV